MQRRPYQQQQYYSHGRPSVPPPPPPPGAPHSSSSSGTYYQAHQDPYNVPHVPIDASTRDRSARSGSGGGCSAFTVLFLMLLTAGAVAAGVHFYMTEVVMVNYKAELQRDEIEPVTEYWSEKYASLERDHQRAQTNAVDLRRELRELEHRVNAEKQSLHNALEEAQSELQRQRDLNADAQNQVVVTDTSHLERKIQELDSTVEHLQKGIQEMSKRAALEKYGPGPYRVEFELKFDPSVAETAGDSKFFVVETAPLEMMPHAIYWFLEQVDRKLFQTNSFYINVPHVVQAGPRSKFANGPSKSVLRRFEESGFKSLYFQEYNPDFTHHPWTVGFAGRPAGPEFYINIHDNIVAHGPGGQGPGGDPCFAKVVIGFDTIERVMKTPGKADDPAVMQKLVSFRSAVILKNQ